MANVFDVQPSYFVDLGKKLPIIDAEAIEILRYEAVRAIAHKSLHLPIRDTQMILNIVRKFEEAREADEGNHAMPEAPG